MSTRGLANASKQARKQPVATTGPGTIGVQWIGLDATPTGTDAAFDAVADFTGAVGTRRLATDADPTDAVAVEPWTKVDSQTQGSTFQAGETARGRWMVKAVVRAVSGAGAVSVRVGLGVDGVAADFDAATTPASPDGTRTIDIKTKGYAAGAGNFDDIEVTTIVDVRQDDRPIVRVYLSNGAGAAPPAATLNLATTFISFERLGDVD